VPDGDVVDEETVTGTWESHAEAGDTLPQTGAGSAGIGVAGLLLVGAGLGLRRAARGQAN
jgi:LPXTG-motif cell wall-anchored protein